MQPESSPACAIETPRFAWSAHARAASTPPAELVPLLVAANKSSRASEAL